MKPTSDEPTKQLEAASYVRSRGTESLSAHCLRRMLATKGGPPPLSATLEF